MKRLIILLILSLMMISPVFAYTQNYGTMDLQEIGLDNTSNFIGEFMRYWFVWGPILFIVGLKLIWLALTHKYRGKFF